MSDLVGNPEDRFPHNEADLKLCHRFFTVVTLLLFRVVDPKTKKVHHVRLAFQVYVKPGSYKIGPQTIGANEQIDARFSNSELEWSTKERGSTLLHSLLMKVE